MSGKNVRAKAQKASPRGTQKSSTPDLNSITDSDDFRMYCMKVLPCSKRVAHDWTSCVFSHNGEKARRRDPRKYNYTGIACVDMKETGSCERGDDCPYAHSTFEYWLHPTRYRTQLCKDLGNCRREICFFAHRTEELRVPDEKPYISPEQLAMSSLSGIRRSMEKGRVKDRRPYTSVRTQTDDLAFTPFSQGQSEVASPRMSTCVPVAVRSSAPLSNPVFGRSPQDSWIQPPVRKSADDVAVPAAYGVPFESQRQRADEIALADALAKLSVALNQQHGDQGKDDVIQTVHKVLQQALDQKESSLGFDLSRSLGGMGYNSSSEFSASARSSSDIETPPYRGRTSADLLVIHPQNVDPWSKPLGPLDFNNLGTGKY
jgi:hypothetical protein